MKNTIDSIIEVLPKKGKLPSQAVIEKTVAEGYGKSYYSLIFQVYIEFLYIGDTTLIERLGKKFNTNFINYLNYWVNARL